MALYKINDNTVIAFFEDIYQGGDLDFDDMVVKIEASPVPIPAALPRFAGGLAGLGVLARRKRRKSRRWPLRIIFERVVSITWFPRGWSIEWFLDT